MDGSSEPIPRLMTAVAKPTLARRGADRLKSQERISSPGNESPKTIAAVGLDDDNRRGSQHQSARTYTTSDSWNASQTQKRKYPRPRDEEMTFNFMVANA